jgi:hypothetical protein
MVLDGGLGAVGVAVGVEVSRRTSSNRDAALHLALIGSMFIILDVSVRVGARLLGRRSR